MVEANENSRFLLQGCFSSLFLTSSFLPHTTTICRRSLSTGIETPTLLATSNNDPIPVGRKGLGSRVEGLGCSHCNEVQSFGAQGLGFDVEVFR